MSQQSTQGFVFYGDGDAENKAAVGAIRTGLIIGAIITAVVAGIIFAWPGVTLAIVAVVFGLFILIRGIVRLIAGIFAPGFSAGGRVISIIIGVLLVAASIFMLRNLEGSLLVLGLLIGLSWIIDGIATLIESSRDGARGFSIVAGIIGILAGIVVLFVPVGGVVFLTYFTASVLIVLAILQLIGAIMVGKTRR